MNRISWDTNELESLADETAKLLLAHPGESLTVLLHRAMKTALAPNRYRKLASYKQAGPDFMKYLKLSLSDKRPAMAAPTMRNVIEYAEPDENEVLVNCSTTQLVTVLTSRFILELSALSEALKKAGLVTGVPVKATIEPPVKHESTVIKCGIAGLDASHFYALQNRMDSRIKLSYMNQERPQAPPSLDHVLVVGSAKRYWKEFESPKVRYVESSALGDITSYIRANILPSSTG